MARQASPTRLSSHVTDPAPGVPAVGQSTAASLDDPLPVAHVAVVVPCYNEAERLDRSHLLDLAARPGTILVLVDDGSTDDTGAMLQMMAEHPGVHHLSMSRNRGKAEAVRAGMLWAAERGVDIIGYLDADLATPVSEAQRLATLLSSSSYDVVLGARVGLAGRTVHRRAWRHYLGRCISTFLSIRHSLRIYDTQCGAKFFRNGTPLRESLEEPFSTRWLFDVELLVRLDCALHVRVGRRMSVREEPLERWLDVAGSRLTHGQIGHVLHDLLALESALPRTWPQVARVSAPQELQPVVRARDEHVAYLAA